MSGLHRRARVVVASVFVLGTVAGGCGAFGSGDDAAVLPNPDASIAPMPTDGATERMDGTPSESPRCDDLAPFTSVEVVVGGTPGNTQSQPTLTADELTIYFVYGAAGNPAPIPQQLYRATRNSIDAPFDPAAVVTELKAFNYFITPGISPQGEALFFALAAGAGTGASINIYRSPLDAGTKTFGSPALLADLAVGAGGVHWFPFVSADAARLYFSSTPSPKAGFFISSSTVEADGKYAPPIQLATADGGLSGVASVVTSDERTVFYSTPPGGTADPAEGSIFYAHRQTIDGTFEAPQPVRSEGDPINTDAKEVPGAISRDSCRLYFVRNLSTTSSILVAKRRP